MFITIPIILAIAGDGSERYYQAGPEMPLAQCMAMSQSLAAGFMSKRPDLSFDTYICIERKQALKLLSMEEA